MARPRVVLACDEAESAVRMIAALNPKRYRVEHIFDLSEALLRAKIVLAHALVVHVDSFEEDIHEACEPLLDRLSVVLVSSDPDQTELADALGARLVAEPIEVPTFKRAVYRAVSKAQDRRQRMRHSPPTGVRRVGKVVLIHERSGHGSVMAAVLRNQLGVTTEAVTRPEDALAQLDESVDCVIASPELLMATAAGATLAQEMARRGVQIVPLDVDEAPEVSEAGRLAWDILPRVRRSLIARDKVREAV